MLACRSTKPMLASWSSWLAKRSSGACSGFPARIWPIICKGLQLVSTTMTKHYLWNLEGKSVGKGRTLANLWHELWKLVGVGLPRCGCWRGTCTPCCCPCRSCRSASWAWWAGYKVWRQGRKTHWLIKVWSRSPESIHALLDLHDCRQRLWVAHQLLRLRILHLLKQLWHHCWHLLLQGWVASKHWVVGKNCSSLGSNCQVRILHDLFTWSGLSARPRKTPCI